MKNLTKIILLFVTVNSIAQNQIDYSKLITEIQFQINEAQQLVNEIGSGKISEVYFQRLKESQVTLAQLKAAPIKTKLNTDEFNELYFNIDNILNPSNVETNKLKQNLVNQKGSGNGVIRGEVTFQNASTIWQSSNSTVSIYDIGGNYIESKNTDTQGRYIFNSLTSGSYYIFVTTNNSNVLDTVYPNTICIGGIGQGCQVEDLTVVTLLDNEIKEHINIRLVTNPTISGTIYESNNLEPLASAKITVYDNNGLYMRFYYSNNDGLYNIYVSEPGEYYLTVEHSSFQKQLYKNISCINTCEVLNGTPITLNFNDHISDFDFSLIQSTSISGTVVSGVSSEQLDSVRIRIFDNFGEIVSTTGSEADGSWVFEHISAGDYNVTSSKGGYSATLFDDVACATQSEFSCVLSQGTIVNHRNTPTENILFRQQAIGSSRIKGRVVDSQGQPIRSARLYVFNIDFYNLTNEPVYTDFDGIYASELLIPGNYYIGVSKYSRQDELYPNFTCTNFQCDFSQAGIITIIENSNVENIDFQLNNLGSVSGRVLDVNNNPVGNIRVSARGANIYNYVSETTDSQGNYTVQNLSEDSYQIYVDSYSFISESYNNLECSNDNCMGDPFIPVPVNETDITNINFQLVPKGKVQFNLKSNFDNSIVYGYINIYDSNGNFISKFDSYLYSILDAGDYYFSYERKFSQNHVEKVFEGDDCDVVCLPMTGKLVHVSNGTEQVFDMFLDEHFKINIANPNTSLSVKVYGEDNVLLNSDSIYSNDSLHVHGLDKVKLKFSASGYYGQIYNGIDCLNSACELSSSDLITPQLNSSININVNLTPIMGSISGTITDYDGNLVSSKTVYLYDSLSQNYSLQSTYTNSSGIYSFSHVPHGDYYIKIGKFELNATTYYGNIGCEESCQNTNIPAITVNHGDNLTGYDIQTRKLGSISGEGILTLSGEPHSSKIFIYKDAPLSENYPQTIIVNNDGTMPEVFLPQGSYKLVLESLEFYNVISAFPAENCYLQSLYDCSRLSTTLNVTNENNTHFNSFIVHQPGFLQVNVKDSITGLGIEYAKIELHGQTSNGLNFQQISQDSLGESRTQLTSRSFYITAHSSVSNDIYISELYNNIDCILGVGIDCQLSQGQLVHVTNDTTTVVNIDLNRKPNLKVNVFNTFTNQLIGSKVLIFNSNYNIIGSSTSTFSNIKFHLFDNLNPGIYYILVEGADWTSRYSLVGYPNVDCSQLVSQLECLTNSTPIVLDFDDDLLELNTYSTLMQGINGNVTDINTNEPIEGVILDFWDINGQVASSTTTTTVANGGFSHGVNLGEYYISTDTGSAYINEVYKDINCDNAAIIGNCDVTQGEIISVPQNNITPVVVNLELEIIDPIYMNGFE